jgi:NAD(P)-dependent dehydrogenase (short-subunit alcohol dehydrogenase family)
MSNDKPIALVTGASRGIGHAVAKALAANGYRVVATARSQKALESLDDQIRAAGGEATLVPMDLKDYDAIDRLGGALFERFGKLDALAACAGVLGDLTPVFQARPPMMEEVYAVNVIANARLIRSMDPLLRAAPAARAVFATSGVASKPRAFWGPYASSKAALESLVLTYAQEVAITNIKVNLFNPAPTHTTMRYKAYPGEDPTTIWTAEEAANAMLPLLLPSFTKHGEVIDNPRKTPAKS